MARDSSETRSPPVAAANGTFGPRRSASFGLPCPIVGHNSAPRPMSTGSFPTGRRNLYQGRSARFAAYSEALLAASPHKGPGRLTLLGDTAHPMLPSISRKARACTSHAVCRLLFARRFQGHARQRDPRSAPVTLANLRPRPAPPRREIRQCNRARPDFCASAKALPSSGHELRSRLRSCPDLAFGAR